ncbi:vesicle transport protein SFT2B isoform X2 [Macadamia integrifolia]|uniref:vesicle transport protein SFT2B isoform X2 n=1 Tax=Macadamia integrifolia TaxID=60698 RepID=UPI001C4EA3BA|nr:vesicle transport protein SFT2B isoform X2 [Macadamia integrifolia]
MHVTTGGLTAKKLPHGSHRNDAINFFNRSQQSVKSKLKGYTMWKLNLPFLDGDEEQEGSLLGESDGLCSLSPMQRIYGFAASLVAGLAFMLLSLIVFAKPIKFAIMFSFGNILAVGSTAFLIGPGQQITMMLDSSRIYATAIYIGSVLLALISALWIHNEVLTLLAMISEICALICPFNT